MSKHTIYKVGLAERDITPPAGILTEGFATLMRKASTGIELNLKALVAYIEDYETNPFLLVSIEWLGFYDKADLIRKAISRATGLAPHQISLTATHTHAGPRIRERNSDTLGPIDQTYFNEAVGLIVDAAHEAMTSTTDSLLDVHTSEFELAVNRRRINPQGIADWAPAPDGPVDKTLYALSIRNATDGQLRGLLFSYACHPTSRHTLMIGGDYVGFTYKHLSRSLPDVKTGFIQGFAGDIKPNFTTDDGTKFRQVGSDEIEAVAIRLAQVLTTMLGRSPTTNVCGILRASSRTIPLRLERPSPQLHAAFMQSDLDICRNWATTFPHSAQDPSPPSPISFEIQLLRFGSSLALVFLAGEISVGYAAAIKDRLGNHFKTIIPVGYANAMIGYVAAANQITEGGYEVWYAHQHHKYAGFFTEETEADILTAIEQLCS